MMTSSDAGKFTKGRNAGTAKCAECGKTRQRANMANEMCCLDCYEIAGLENEHLDGGHESDLVIGCPMCKEDADELAIELPAKAEDRTEKLARTMAGLDNTTLVTISLAEIGVKFMADEIEAAQHEVARRMEDAAQPRDDERHPLDCMCPLHRTIGIPAPEATAEELERHNAEMDALAERIHEAAARPLRTLAEIEAKRVEISGELSAVTAALNALDGAKLPTTERVKSELETVAAALSAAWDEYDRLIRLTTNSPFVIRNEKGEEVAGLVTPMLASTGRGEAVEADLGILRLRDDYADIAIAERNARRGKVTISRRY